MTGPEFGEWCWSRGIVPVSPRFGQGDNAKSWHTQLVNAVAHKEHMVISSLEGLVDHPANFLRFDTGPSCHKAAVIASICDLPPDGRMPRVQTYHRVLGSMPGVGHFALKNYFEALVRSEENMSPHLSKL
eukprot:12431513-Karenia_brevis.AAC.3